MIGQINKQHQRYTQQSSGQHLILHCQPYNNDKKNPGNFLKNGHDCKTNIIICNKNYLTEKSCPTSIIENGRIRCHHFLQQWIGIISPSTCYWWSWSLCQELYSLFIVVPLATKPLTTNPVLVNIIIPWWWVSWMRPYHGGCDCWCCCHEHCLSCQLPKSLCQNFICWISKGSEDSTLCPHSLLLPSPDKPHQFGDQYGLWGTTYPPPCWKWVTPTPKIVWKFLDHSSDIFNFSEYQLLQHWLQLKLTLVIWD